MQQGAYALSDQLRGPSSKYIALLNTPFASGPPAMDLCADRAFLRAKLPDNSTSWGRWGVLKLYPEGGWTSGAAYGWYASAAGWTNAGWASTAGCTTGASAAAWASTAGCTTGAAATGW